MINLIENSGIQFITKKIRIASERRDFAELREEKRSESGTFEFTRFIIPYRDASTGTAYDLTNVFSFDIFWDKNGELLSDELNLEGLPPLPDDDLIYTVKTEDALLAFEGKWVPIPYLRIKTERPRKYVEGPHGWARMKITRDVKTQDEDIYNLCLAFDTRTVDNDARYYRMNQLGNMEPVYLLPKKEDATTSNNIHFSCAYATRDILITNLLRLGRSADDKQAYWFTEWIRKTVQDADDEFQSANAKIKKLRREKIFFDHALYLTLLHSIGSGKALNNFSAFPTIALTKKQQSIDTTLIVDIGNSRTCGLIVENDSDFKNVTALELIDLENPFQVDKSPFDMQVIFKNEDFGDKNNLLQPLDSMAFTWPSPIRLGAEASKTQIFSNNHNSNHRLSSPKRYLWDTEPAKLEWQANDGRPAMLKGPGDLFNHEGELFIYTDKENAGTPLTGPNIRYDRKGERILKRDFFGSPSNETANNLVPKNFYSRKSLMTFSFMEIILHAISQSNSYTYRDKNGNKNTFRRLKDIVLTCPTAMPKREKIELRQCAEDAIDALKYYYFNKSDLVYDELNVVPSPLDLRKQQDSEVWNYDEATCNQLVYLYGELDKFRFDSFKFFQFFSSERNGEKNIRIASIDMGAGTTDLSICDYLLDQKGSVGIYPKPVFWEGFNLAGDHIAKVILEEVLVKQIKKHFQAQDDDKADDLILKLFGRIGPLLDARQLEMRPRLASKLLIPVAYNILGIVEKNKSGSQSLGDLTSSVADFLDIRQFILKEAGDLSLNANDLWDLEIDINIPRIEKIIEQAIQDVLPDLCRINLVYDPDIILISGRPSKLPVIRKLLEKYLPSKVDRLVFLGDHQIGSWFPFASLRGHLNDPKTCVAVGAALAYLSESNALTKFKMGTKNLQEIGSTVNYIGKSNNKKLKNDEILLSPQQRQCKITFSGQEIKLRYRQLNSEDWLTSLLYVVEKGCELFYTNTYNMHSFQLPFEVHLSVDEDNRENIRIEEIVDSEGRTIPDVFIKKDLQVSKDDFNKYEKYAQIVDGEKSIPGNMPNTIIFKELRIPTVKLKFKTLDEKSGYWKDTAELDV
jgi:hypothetical protein